MCGVHCRTFVLREPIALLDLVLRIWTWSYAGPPCNLCVALLHCIRVRSIDAFVCVCVRVCSVHVFCALAFGFCASVVSDLYKLLCTVYSVLLFARESWDFVFLFYSLFCTVQLRVLYFWFGDVGNDVFVQLLVCYCVS